MPHCCVWGCLVPFNESTVIPKENRWASVQVCVCVCMCAVCVLAYTYTHLLTALLLQARGRIRFGWLILLCHSQLFAKAFFFISALCTYVSMLVCLCATLDLCLRVCVLFGDLEVWSTQNMNKWKALAVGTEVFARSKDPSSHWTHPAVPLSLQLRGGRNTSKADNSRPQHISHGLRGLDTRSGVEEGAMEGWMDRKLEGRACAFVRRREHPSWESNPLRALYLFN